MKKLLLITLLICVKQINAQCPITITGNTVVCAGGCTTFIASGATSYTWIPSGSNSSTLNVCPNVTTIYTVTGTTGTCTATNTVAVVINAPPIISVNSSTICAGTTTTLTASGAATYTWFPGGATSNVIVVSPTVNTTYTVTGTDINACTNSATSTVTIIPSPTVSYTLTQNITPHVWDAYPTYSGGAGGYTYSWDWGDGSSDFTAYPSHTYTTAGKYNICVTIADANGCIATSCQNDSVYKMSSSSSMVTINVINGSFGINQNISNNNNVSIYPNPTSDQFIIETNTTDKLYVDLFDVNGRHVFSQIVSDKANINVTTLDEGIYTLTIKTVDRVINKKLVIVR